MQCLQLACLVIKHTVPPTIMQKGISCIAAGRPFSSVSLLQLACLLACLLSVSFGAGEAACPDPTLRTLVDRSSFFAYLAGRLICIVTHPLPHVRRHQVLSLNWRYVAVRHELLPVRITFSNRACLAAVGQGKRRKRPLKC